MPYKYFSRNGDILPIEQAVVPLGSIEYSYGFGVYETIRLSGSVIYFLEEHCQRLLESARLIALPHTFSADFAARSVRQLVDKLETETCNLKVLLIGGSTPEAATLYIMGLNPLFPDRKLYTDGAATITYQYERDFPHAKTLNMLSSYLAYRQARAAGAYDALLVNRNACVTEGTRTNFFGLKDRVIVTPPEDAILLGVTRGHVLEVARQNDFEILERDIPLTDIGDYDACFLTSTSSKILPIRSIDGHTFGRPTAPLKELMQAFDQFLKGFGGTIAS
jgi:branched-chain amino acid aminotransferase